MSRTESPKRHGSSVLYFSLYCPDALAINFVNHGGWFKLIVGIAATTVVLRRRDDATSPVPFGMTTVRCDC